MNLKTALDILTALCLIVFGLQVLATRAAFGSLFLVSTATMARVTLRGPKILLLICGLQGLLLAAFHPSWAPPFPPMLMTGLSLLVLNGACLPPAVLYLGVSRRDGWMLAGPLQRAVVPLKFIHLLDSSLEIDPFSRTEARMTGFRVWPKVDWRPVVRELAGIAPVLIVDGRTESPSLTHEIDQIIKSGFQRRVFFLGDARGNCRALSKIGAHVGTMIHVTTPDRLIRSLRGIGWLCILHDAVTPSFVLAQRLGFSVWSHSENQ
jgi:hypothetical protein